MKLETTYSPEEDDVSVLYHGLLEFNRPHFPGGREEKLALFARDDSGAIVGGVLAFVYLSTYVKYLWVAENQRGRGLGSKLLDKLEVEAEKAGSHSICLDTYSFQAPTFYKNKGYTEVGRFRDYPKPGSDKIFYQKRLDCPGPRQSNEDG